MQKWIWGFFRRDIPIVFQLYLNKEKDTESQAKRNFIYV